MGEEYVEIRVSCDECGDEVLIDTVAWIGQEAYCVHCSPTMSIRYSVTERVEPVTGVDLILRAR